MNLQGVGKRIKAIRGVISQAKFGELTGMGQKYISQVEKEEVKPSIKCLMRIKEYSGASVDFLLTGELPTEIARNQSQIGIDQEGHTDLAKKMYKSINQLSFGIKSFDNMAVEYNNLKKLEEVAESLRTSPDTFKYLSRVQDDALAVTL